jgi:hypothetical protein
MAWTVIADGRRRAAPAGDGRAHVTAIRRRTRIWLAAGAGVAVAVAAAALALVLRAHPAPAPQAQARQYLNVTACLLTGPRGVAAGTPAAAVWTTMQSASLATHVMVTYLPVTTAAQTPILLNTLVARQCGVIVTSGAAPAQVLQAAKANPRQRFVLVTAGAVDGAASSNVAVASARSPATPIDQAIRALAAAA